MAQFHFTGSQRLAQQVYTALCQMGAVGEFPDLIDMEWFSESSDERRFMYKHNGNRDVAITLRGRDEQGGTRWFVAEITTTRGGVTEVVKVPDFSRIERMREEALRRTIEANALGTLYRLTSRGFQMS